MKSASMHPEESLLPSPSAEEAELARQSSQRLSGVSLDGGTLNLALAGTVVRIPASAARVLLQALEEMGRGHAVAAVALDKELSTQEAAALLGVSRPFVAKMLDEKVIPSRKVGTHRRVLAADVLAYRRHSEGDRRAALTELAAQAQELRMGY